MSHRLVYVLSLLVFLTLWPSAGMTHDAFTGFELDDRGQYYGFLGLQTPLTSIQKDLDLFAQLYAATLRYSFRSDGNLLNARVDSITPSVGLRQRFDPWNVSVLAGPQFREKHEDVVNGGRTTSDEVGAFLQGETFYWHERGSFHGIISYSTLDDFFWGRLRGKVSALKTNGGHRIYAGWDVIGMGNKDFNAFHTGPLVEVPIGKVFFLIKGGYKYTSAFHNGEYTGLEIYLPF